MVRSAAAFTDHIAKAAAFIPESNGLLNFAHIVGSEIPGAVDQTSKLLRQHATMVLAGSAPPTLKPPAEAYVPAPAAPAKEPTVLLFCVTSTKWIDAEGKQQIAPQYTDAQIPQRLASRAFRIGACVRLDHPARKANHRQGGVAKPEHCADLDAASGREGPPIFSEPELVPFDRGPAIQMQVATRSDPT
jgi:hypothetical protein